MEISEQFRANRFYIVQSTEGCWKCKRETKVVAFFLPEGHERFDYVYDEEEGINVGEWSFMPYDCFLNYVSWLSSDLVQLIQNISMHYYYDFSNTTRDHYYMNHCEHCSAKQGDFFLFSQPGGSFSPLSYKEAENMKFDLFELLFEAKAGGYSSVPFLDYKQAIEINKTDEYTVEKPPIKNSEQLILADKPLSTNTQSGLQSILSILSKIYFTVKNLFYDTYIYIVRNNWRMSKNGNLYNPIIKSTVYRNAFGWNMARYGTHYCDFSSQKEAMNAALEMWLAERSLKT